MIVNIIVLIIMGVLLGIALVNMPIIRRESGLVGCLLILIIFLFFIVSKVLEIFSAL